jgi:ATP-dependent DNA helicase RecG
MPISYEGAYWMRAGEDLVPMTPDLLKRIFDEAAPVFSAEICPNATLSDLDSTAIEDFRKRWHKKSQNAALLRMSHNRLLQDAELSAGPKVTYAALIFLGKRAALGRHLAQAEVIFEYRSSNAAGPANQREEFRQGLLTFFDRLWELVNLRNDAQHYKDGLVMQSVSTFHEGAVREAILNAVAHRDYRHSGSVFVRQYARRIEITSPGGFPPGITPENILEKQSPRNRRIAETLFRCGLVERSGQGADRIFEECLRHGQALPNYTRSDAHDVFLVLDGQLRHIESQHHQTCARRTSPERKGSLVRHPTPNALVSGHRQVIYGPEPESRISGHSVSQRSSRTHDLTVCIWGRCAMKPLAQISILNVGPWAIEPAT